jgi:hypothetical protein
MRRRPAAAGLLAALAAALLAACAGVGAAPHAGGSGRGSKGASTATPAGAVGHSGADRTAAGGQPSAILARLGLPAVPAGSALPGYLLIADRENNRVIIVSPARQIVWSFPGSHERGAASGLVGPDDAFLAPNGLEVTTNEENSQTVAAVSLTTHPRIIWRYGQQDVPGSESGHLYHPDDAYLLPDGLMSVADIVNCRVIWIDHAKRIVRQLGSTGECEHDPPRRLDLPNGDTPLPDGGVLVTEIGGWIDRFSRSGHLVWSIKAPGEYPSDAQLLPEGNVLLASYTEHGAIYIIDPRGDRVVWSYAPSRGPGALDHPSLALALPNGMIAATDDWHDRVVIIDRATKRVVWHYGHDGVAGRAPGYLNTPDGLDLVG